MKNLIFILIVITAGCAQRGVEGKLKLFDGRPAAKVTLLFETSTDMKNEQKLARIEANTNDKGEYKISRMLQGKEYSISVKVGFIPEMGVPNNMLQNKTVEAPEKGIRMVDDIILYPVPPKTGIFYFADSKTRVQRLNDYFDKTTPLNLSAVNYRDGDYYYLTESDLNSVKNAPVLKTGGMVLYAGPNDVNRGPIHPDLLYDMRPLSLIDAQQIHWYDMFYEVPKAYYLGIQGFRFVESWTVTSKAENSLKHIGTSGDFAYYTVSSRGSGYCCCQRFSQPGYFVYYGNYGYVVKVE